MAKKFDQNLKISGVEKKVLLKPVEHSEMIILLTRENKKFCLTCLLIGMNMRNTIFFTEFR